MRRRAGRAPSFRDELEAYFDVSVRPGDPDRYRAVHAELAELLPGGGPLAARMAAYRKREQMPAERLGPAVQALSAALRERTRALGLPAGESVRYELTRDRPWTAFNEYLGGYRSRVLLNADAAGRASALPALVAHEAYPGHHAERCLREVGPVRRDGHREQSVFLVNSPQALISEGMAEQALYAAVGPEWGRWAQEVLAGRGISLDGELAERVEKAYAGLAGVRQDAALMLYERAEEPEEVVAHLRRWLLVGEARARRMLSFLVHPLWRAYSTTYSEGAWLVRAWLDARPAGEPVLTRYRRLADEPVTPGLLRAELGAPAPPRAERRDTGPR